MGVEFLDQTKNGTTPFSSKKFGDKSLFKRVHGVTQALNTGANTITFAIPYPWVKITGLEIVNGAALETASVSVLDSTSGTYTGVANYKLNQFGFNIVVAKDYYEHKSEYDADLYYGMQIQITYESLSDKTVGINFILNEVK